jgi:1-acyl-sn-glycerol-3-phosphate acyltransferase
MTEAPATTAPEARRGSGHSTFGRWLYSALWILCRTLGVSVFGVRTRFAEPLPKTGGLLVLSSHQSHLDPLLLGLACDRRLSSLARASLYKFKPFGYVITALDAVPIDREASTVAAMKAVIRRLEGGAAVIVFPEGARTFTGRLAELKSGFALLAKRAKVPIVPVAIVGAWECWPRTRLFPRPGRVRLEFGKLLRPEEIAAMDERQILAECTARLTALDAEARRVRNHGRPSVTAAGGPA